MANRVIRVVAVIGLVVLVAACSPSAQDQPEAIDRDDVPFGLAVTTSTTRHESSRGGGAVTLYLVADDELVPVNRPVDRIDVETALDLLVEGPTTEESRLGLTTAVPSGTRVQSVKRDGRQVTVTLASDRATAGSGALAIGQLVLTATSVPGVERVRFRVDGAAVQVPEADGTLTKAPVGRSDYERLVRPDARSAP